MWVLVSGTIQGSFVKGQCYRLAVEFFSAYEVDGDEGYAHYLNYEIVHPDAYELLNNNGFWQYRR